MKPSIREPCFCPNVAYDTLVQQQEAGSSVSKPSPPASLLFDLYLWTGHLSDLEIGEKNQEREDGGGQQRLLNKRPFLSVNGY